MAYSESMPLPDEKTMAFDLWPNLLLIEGPTNRVGLLLASLYDDASIPRDAWNVSSQEKSRKTYAEALQRGGEEKIRQGMGVRTEEVVRIIQERAKSMQLAAIRFSGKSMGAI
jgi:hypothetical protein